MTTLRRRFNSPNMPIGFPPFTKGIKWLVIINAAVYLLMALLGATDGQLNALIYHYFALIPGFVVHGDPFFHFPFLWQIVTYAFIHVTIWHILFNMLSLWFIGALLEMDWGTSRFLDFYFFCVIGAALTTIAISYTYALHMGPYVETVGASGGIFGVLIAFGILYAEQEIYLFPLPFGIKAKYVAAIWILIALASALQSANGVANIAHLGGLFFGFVYVKWGPRRTFATSIGDRWYAMRNGYYRWKRRRAARKFQVYMKKQGQDQTYFFDEYGNYRGPGTEPPREGGKSGKTPWVN